MNTVHNAITEPVRRVEVFTGAGRRRRWSAEDKARIVTEIVTSGASVSAVARRHGLSPQQLFGWRRQLRESAVGLSDAEDLQFVPAVVDVGGPAPAGGGARQRPPRKTRADIGMIAVEGDGRTTPGGRGRGANKISSGVRGPE